MWLILFEILANMSFGQGNSPYLKYLICQNKDVGRIEILGRKNTFDIYFSKKTRLPLLPTDEKKLRSGIWIASDIVLNHSETNHLVVKGSSYPENGKPNQVKSVYRSKHELDDLVKSQKWAGTQKYFLDLSIESDRIITHNLGSKDSPRMLQVSFETADYSKIRKQDPNLSHYSGCISKF